MLTSNQSWLDAQCGVLGSALIEPKVVAKVMAQTSEADFSDAYLTVYRAMIEVFESGFPVDIISVAAKLGAEYHDFLMQMMVITPTAANVDTYIILCREQSRLLACQEIGHQLAECTSVSEVRSLVEEATKLISATQRKQTANMSESLQRFFEKLEQPTQYLTWPIPVLNNNLYVNSGNLVVLGAEPSVGKTTLALQCAWHWATQRNVGFFSFETDSDTLFDRLIASFAGIPMEAIKSKHLSPEELERVRQATQEITTRQLDLIPAAGMDCNAIRSKVLAEGYEIIIIDYLQIVSAKGFSRYEQVTSISIDLHNIAQSLGVTVLALSQLSRAAEKGSPRNSTLRESGQIEQAADVILMMQLVNQNNISGLRKLFITKNKEGRHSQVLLTFDGDHQRFSEADDQKHSHSIPIREQFGMLTDNLDLPFK